MLELGGNIYFTAKLGATDGHSFQHLAAVMTGSTQEDYAKMMLAGGRSVEGVPQQVGQDCGGETARKEPRRASGQRRSSRPRRPNPKRRPAAKRSRNVARIIAGVATSHVPAIGAAIDNGIAPRSPIGSRCFRGFEKSQGVDGEDEARRRDPASTTITPRRSRSRSSRPSRSAARRNSRRPTKAGDRGRCRW